MKHTSLFRVIILGVFALAGALLGSASRSPAQVSQTIEGEQNLKPDDAVLTPMANWPQFRGPNASGVSHDRGLPVEFSATKRMTWKTPIPSGNSSPCVWGNRIFLTGVTDSKQLVVLCVDRDDGRIQWQREVAAERIEDVHPRVGSPASPTPAADGEHVYVFFGAVGVVCFDFQGQQIWRHDLGPFTYHLGWGAASSPIVYEDSVILNCDHDGESFLLALDKQTGEEKWRTPRPQASPSYSTPILWEVDGQKKLIIAGSGQVTAYNADTGEELWQVQMPESFVATTPVVGDGLLFVTAVDRNSATGDFSGAVKMEQAPNFDAMFANHDGDRDGVLNPKEVPQMNQKTFDRIDANRDSFLTREELQADFQRQQESGPPAGSRRQRTGNLLMAIRPGGRGDVTETHIAWSVDRVAPYVASPLVYGDSLYLVKEGGIVSCFHPATGELIWKQRIGAPGAYYASPVAGDGKVYLVSEGGQVTVLVAGPKFQLLSQNSLGERCLATPAIVSSQLYFRTERSLYCIGNDGTGPSDAQSP